MFKIDHPPSLGPGRHNLTIDQFSSLFAKKSERREKIFDEFNVLLRKLSSFNFPCELWLDGSYVTEKSEPNDLDFSIMIISEVYDSIHEDAKNLLDEISDFSKRYSELLDPFVQIIYDKSDKFYDADDSEQGYSELWGIERGDYWLKGYVVIRLDDGYGKLCRQD